MKELSFKELSIVAGGAKGGKYFVTEPPEGLIGNYTQQLHDKISARVTNEYTSAMTSCVHNVMRSPDMQKASVDAINACLDMCITSKMNVFIHTFAI